MSNKILTLDQIKLAQDVAREEIDIPQWGGAVVVQGVNVADGIALLKEMQDDKGNIDPEKSILYAIVVGVIDPKFSTEDVEWLKTKSMAAASKIAEAFMRLSGFDSAAVREARKNSSATGG